jgi:hypothetical protein
MKPIAPSEILNLHEYEKVRDSRRRAVIEHKRVRRVSVGRHLSFVFEDRQTVWFQIQEMCRAERIADDDRVAEEVAVYNTLLPRPGELAATMLIEIETAALIRPVLDALVGVDTRDCVRLEVGSRALTGAFEAGHSDAERGKISAVHFVRFAVPRDVRRNFQSHEVALVVDHPSERARAVLSAATKSSLAADLA